MPAAPAESFGILDPDDVAFVEERLTPHPIATYQNALAIKAPVGNGLPTSYIMCVDPIYEPMKVFHQRAHGAG